VQPKVGAGLSGLCEFEREDWNLLDFVMNCKLEAIRK
jgi:hypothetical protein